MPSSTSSSERVAPSPTGCDAESRKVVAWTALLLIGSAAALQLAPMRPPVLTGSDRTMQQYERFREHTARGDVFDWIAFGSSFTRRGLDPRVVDPLWSQRSARPVHGYNFGTGGLSVLRLESIVELAYGVQPPATALFVLPPTMLFTASPRALRRSRLLAESPYGRALDDPVAPRGSASRWLLDRVALIGLRHAFKDRLLGRAGTAWEPLEPSESRGFDLREGERDTFKRFQRFLRGGVDPPFATARIVDALARARALGASRLVVVEGLLHPRAMRLVEEAELWVDAYRRLLSDAAARAGAQVLLREGEAPFPESAFLDPQHLSAEGAARFSEWIARAAPTPSP